MTSFLTKATLHRNLLKDCVPNDLSEADTLLWMVLLHTHQIRLQTDVVTGANGVPVDVPALTQRHAAEVAAELWSELKPGESERAHYEYWYRRYNTETPYEDFGDVPAALAPRLAELRDTLAGDARVVTVVPEE